MDNRWGRRLYCQGPVGQTGVRDGMVVGAVGHTAGSVGHSGTRGSSYQGII